MAIRFARKRTQASRPKDEDWLMFIFLLDLGSSQACKRSTKD